MHTKLHTQHFHDKCRGTVLQISLKNITRNFLLRTGERFFTGFCFMILLKLNDTVMLVYIHTILTHPSCCNCIKIVMHIIYM